jgi:hypothetical protein
MRSHEELEELLGAYALDAVDPEEAAELSAHLETCPRCTAELAAHREVTALFAYTGQEAPEGLWDEIAHRIHGGTPELRIDELRPRMATPTPASARRRSGVRRSLPWKFAAPIAAAAAIAIAVLGVAVAHDGHGTQAAATMADVRQAVDSAGSRKVVLKAPAGGATLDAVITSSGEGYVYGEHDMPSLDSDRTYQLWGVVGHEAISYGLLGDHPSVVRFEAGSGVRALAVTDEVASGVVVSHQKALVAGAVPGATSSD